MFDLGQDDFVPARHIGVAPGTRYQVDCVCSSLGKDHLVGLCRINECRGSVTSRFVFGRSLFAQRMQTTMNIGVIRFVVPGERFDHRAWFLCRSGVIQVYKGTVIYLRS